MNKMTASMFVLWFVTSFALPLKAQLLDMKDDQMGDVTAQAGLSVSLNNATFYDEYGRIEIKDSANTGSLAFEDVVVDNGNGWGYSFSTSKPLLIDLVDISAGYMTYFLGIPLFYVDDETNVGLNVYAESWSQNVQFTANHLLFCNQDLGKLQVGPMTMPTYQFTLTTPDSSGDDESGLYFRYLFQSTIGTAGLTYNTQNKSLLFQNVRFARSFSGAARTPSAWAASGSYLVGKDDHAWGIDKFASINVVKKSGKVALEAEIPMEGSIRIDKVQFDARSFGPVAVDGIKVHTLTMQFVP